MMRNGDDNGDKRRKETVGEIFAKSEGRKTESSIVWRESEVIDSLLPSMAPFRRDRTSNKACLMTLFNKGCASSSSPFHSFIPSPLPPVLPWVMVSLAALFHLIHISPFQYFNSTLNLEVSGVHKSYTKSCVYQGELKVN